MRNLTRIQAINILLFIFCTLCPSISLASVLTTPPRYGLAAWYRLDEGTGTTATDSSWNGYTATLTNNPTWTTGMNGQGRAVSFDGSSNYIIKNASPVSAFPFTISAWIYKTDSTSGAIIGFGYSGAANYRYYYISAGSVTSLWMRPDTGSTNLSVNGTSNIVGGWHLVTGVYKSDGTQDLYVDGVLEATLSNPKSFASVDQIGIGARVDSVPDTFFKGVIDDARIYNRLLTAEEIRRLYISTRGVHTIGYSNPVITSGLVGYWTMDGKDTNWTSNTMTDKSGRNNTGTMVNMSTTTSPVAGKVGQGLQFDGVNDYINITQAVLPTSGTTEIAFWVKPAYQDTDQVWIHNFLSGSQSVSFTVGQTSVGSGRFGVTVGNNAGHWLQSPMSSNTWHHVVVQISANSVDALYIDGTPQTNLYGNTGFTVGVPATSGFSTTLGRQGLNNAAYFSGSLDDVRIYNRALSASEIQQLYTSASPKYGVSPTITNTTNCTSGLSCGLVGYWTMDGKDTSWTSNTTQDKSGNGNTGTMVNMSTTTSPTYGKVGQGLKFDGVDDFINKSNFSSISSYSFTMSAWVKLDSTANQGIVWIGQSNSVQRNIVLAVYSSTYAVSIRNDTGESPRTFDVAPNGTWQHLVVVVASSGYRQLYVNGIQANIILNGVTPSVPTINTLNIGRFGGSSPIRYASGVIDDVRIYNRELSSAEIQQLYQQGR